MSINSLIDSVVRCAICGTKGIGNCDCWVPCKCGIHIRKGTRCGHPVHKWEHLLKDGYWIIDGGSGRPFKTHTDNLSVIRERMDQGTMFLSLKDARGFLKEVAGGAATARRGDF